MSFNTISSAQARMLFIFPTQRSISLAFSSSATPCFLAISFIRYSAISRAEVSISAKCSYNFPLHKMYTFVYRTFIKFIFFFRGQALDVLAPDGLSCYFILRKWRIQTGRFQCPHGLELLLLLSAAVCLSVSFNALTGLSCYDKNVQYFKFFMILFMHTCYL